MFAAVVRIAAAVYEVVGPALETMQKDMKNMKSDIASLSQKIDNLTEEVDTKLSSLNESMRDDFDDVKTELNGVSNTTTAMCDKIEKHETAIKSDLKDMKENLAQQISGCGGVGWRRAVYLDMTDLNANCPSGWNMTGYSKRTCGRVSTGLVTCDSVFFPVSGGPYSQVCGKIRAYQYGVPNAFYGYIDGQTAVDSVYFDGVAVMHGIPQQHIWTFAAGAWENGSYTGDIFCPCDTTGSHISIPPFVGDDYFCESGYVYPGYRNRTAENRLHSNDALWDGKDCHSTSTCCSFHNPPYFTKTLNQTTSDDLELRMCNYLRFGAIAIELVEMYVMDNIRNSLPEIILQTHRNTANMIYDKIDEHDTQITTQLMKMNQSLTEQIVNNSGGLKCGGTWGWRRAVYLDMTDPNTNCPSGWNMTGYSKRTCGRVSTGSWTCDPVFFPVSGGPYSQVCGRIRAYQYGLPDAFLGYNRGGQTTIDSVYVCGVAVMHGSPRQHIWTFANGALENYTTPIHNNCPCEIGNITSIPPFVGEDYFCESGYVFPGYRNNTAEFRLHSNDILWDGEYCHSTSTCCSFHNPPYFTKTLNQTTSDDLELRMCLRNPIPYDNIAVELVELYVK